jgi:hypothetical protein
MKYIHLDDHTVLTGGTHLTSMALFEDRIDSIESISSSKLTHNHIHEFKDRLWIIGNIMDLYRLDGSTIAELLNTCNFVKVEFDYNYCQARGEVSHEHFLKCRCECPYGPTGKSIIANTYNFINKNAKHIFFMSERQRSIFSFHMPLLPFNRSSILTSTFTKDSLKLFKINRGTKNNNKWAILAGDGGWHSYAKGVDQAVNFCIANDLEYEVLPNRAYEQHIEHLSEFKGMVFLPVIHDTCPRCIIEAKLLELEVITNINSQHVTEDWWNQDIDKIEEYISNRPKYFWSVLDGLSV